MCVSGGGVRGGGRRGKSVEQFAGVEKETKAMLVVFRLQFEFKKFLHR